MAKICILCGGDTEAGRAFQTSHMPFLLKMLFPAKILFNPHDSFEYEFLRAGRSREARRCIDCQAIEITSVPSLYRGEAEP